MAARTDRHARSRSPAARPFAPTCSTRPTQPLLADSFAALADPIRLRLLSHIAASGADEVCACDLTEPSGRRSRPSATT